MTGRDANQFLEPLPMAWRISFEPCVRTKASTRSRDADDDVAAHPLGPVPGLIDGRPHETSLLGEAKRACHTDLR